MAAKRTGRSHSKTIGKKPHTGRRYVQHGKVRIEWYEEGKRRSRTIGPHSAETRDEADRILRDLLTALGSTRRAADQAAGPAPDSSPGSLRGVVSLLFDTADQLADGIRNAAKEIMEQLAEESDEAELAENEEDRSPAS